LIRITASKLVSNPKEKAQLQTMNGLLGLAIHKVQQILSEPPNPHLITTYDSLSEAAEREFNLDSHRAWVKVFGRRKVFSADTVRELVEPDMDFTSGSGGASPVVAASSGKAKGNELKAEMERRKMRDLYFKKLDKIREERYRRCVGKKK
jgi:fructose-1,6-bisphosphatase/sedoheptulose 1,7-bisphosphatase-like protein